MIHIVSINLDGEWKEISPYIYGVNEYGFENKLNSSKFGSTRQGDNRLSGYNWELNFSNAGGDWYHCSDEHLLDTYQDNGNFECNPSGGLDPVAPAYIAQRLSAEVQEYEIPYTLATVQMAGYVSADNDGEVTEAETAPSSRWLKVEPQKYSELSLEPDLDDGVVYMDEYVNYLVNKLGDSTTPTGIKGYCLDNEPELWGSTHNSDLNKSFSFASIDGDDESVVKVVLGNREAESTEKATITIDGSANSYHSARVYAITQDSSEIQLIDVPWQYVKSNQLDNIL